MYVYKKCKNNYKTLLKIWTPQQLGIAKTSLQLTVPWITIKMLIYFSNRQQRQRQAARSLQSAVPRTTIKMSTLRSSRSAVPRTTARTSTCSTKQQRLREAAACLPAFFYPYGYGYPVQLLHPRVTLLLEMDNNIIAGPIDERSKSSDLDCGRGPEFQSQQG